MKLSASLIFILLLTSCSTQAPRKPAEVAAPKKPKGFISQNKILLNHVKKDVDRPPAGQLWGSSEIEDDSRSAKGVYYLYGAEHLNLENNYFDFPIVYNKQVQKWLNYFLNRGKDFFVRYSERSGRYAPVLGRILEEMGLPRDLIFLAMAESGFHNKAKSWARAVGPWQFMPFTGKRYGLKIDWYVDERRDPIKASIAASLYLKDLYRRFGSWELAAAGYNAGEGKIGRAIKRYKTKNFWKISKGRYLKSETKNYVPKIMALAIIGKNLKTFGFDEEIDFKDPLDFDELKIAGNVDLVKVAEASGVSFEEIHRLNPELMRWQTPPNVESYVLRMPVGTAKDWKDCCANKDLTATDYQIYRIKGRTASLKAVAKKFRLPVDVLASLNGWQKGHRLSRGQSVVLPFRANQSRRDRMYADLYERPPRRLRRWRNYRQNLRRGLKRGKLIANPSRFYTVKKGDTLWSVAKNTGVSMDTIIRSNYALIRRRMIRAGDKLAIQ